MASAVIWPDKSLWKTNQKLKPVAVVKPITATSQTLSSKNSSPDNFWTELSKLKQTIFNDKQLPHDNLSDAVPKNYSCGECGKHFENESTSVQHFRTHMKTYEKIQTEEKHFQRKIGEKKFSERSEHEKKCSKNSKAFEKVQENSSSTASNKIKSKKMRTKKCPCGWRCGAEDCGSCSNCRDKTKFGGPNIKKQRCSTKICPKGVPYNNRAKDDKDPGETLTSDDNENNPNVKQKESNKITVSAKEFPQSSLKVAAKTSELNILVQETQSLSISKPEDKFKKLCKRRNEPNVKNQFECSQCRKSFKFIGKFRVHMKLHTGENTLKCSKCEKMFYQKSDIQSHIKKYCKGTIIFKDKRKHIDGKKGKKEEPSFENQDLKIAQCKSLPTKTKFPPLPASNIEPGSPYQTLQQVSRQLVSRKVSVKEAATLTGLTESDVTSWLESLLAALQL